jgi:hypothetical protein
MWRSKPLPWAAALGGIALLLFGVSYVSSQEKKLDFTKRLVIERPVQSVVNRSAAVKTPGPAIPAIRDFGKTAVIEKPLTNLVKVGSAPAPVARPADGFANPKVQPGKVRWHPTLAAASAAAARSKKPVLLFQMMGKLDDQFC